MTDIYGKVDTTSIKPQIEGSIFAQSVTNDSESVALLEIDKLQNNPHARILITFPGAPGQSGEVVIGYVISDFGFGLGASWGGMDLVSSAQRQFQRLANLATLGINQFTGFLEQFGVKGALPQRLFMSLLQTVSAYEGTEKPTISLPLIFVATRPDSDVRRDIFVLLKGVTPIYETAMTLIPPLHYAFDQTPKVIDDKETGKQQTAYEVTNVVGTISIAIGQWFEVGNLVMKGVDFVFSKEVTPLGWPLYARANVSFEPILMWTLTDIKNLFKGLDTSTQGDAI